MKKVKKNFWEELFIYPSFNARFGFIFILTLVFFIVIGYWVLFKLYLIDNISDQISVLNLLVQSLTLVLGAFAAYYALRQMVETRFNSLDETGMLELKNKHYLRAIQKWKEAFYIRPEIYVFNNLAETFLLLGDYDAFDQHANTLQRTGLLKKEIVQENSDRITLLFLKSVRHLLVKNQGEAEKHLSKIVDLISEINGLSGFRWDFSDLKDSESYKFLDGECKIIMDNIIAYLTKKMSPKKKEEFESGSFATKQTE